TTRSSRHHPRSPLLSDSLPCRTVGSANDGSVARAARFPPCGFVEAAWAMHGGHTRQQRNVSAIRLRANPARCISTRVGRATIQPQDVEAGDQALRFRLLASRRKFVELPVHSIRDG